ncbi:hypothetical protein OUZ56_022992 [Daphnia magna]|uniref:Uncharacterized protein n=1 Tax=Daphnia magna TaxID=35525 RepID=A0ABR0AY24_9CRUS|nr:hypothetical protein OUZ56_022992 [Daphnia magna]
MFLILTVVNSEIFPTFSETRFSWPICRIIVYVERYKSASVTQAKSSATSRRFLCTHQIFKMRSQSACGILLLVILGCVLPSTLAAPSSAATDRGDETHDNLSSAVKLVKAYSSDVARVATKVCDKLANGGTLDKILLEIAKDKDTENVDLNEVRHMIEKYGCSATKWTCLLWGAVCWGR